ncbi:class I SAM-dependent methyltransferase family protein [Candidatus Bathyarchaeota archaeon]|nr:MAG: class I SAM-dependent methyltransferase family protein [Candidatus Bathyarchaeota archaeon]
MQASSKEKAYSLKVPKKLGEDSIRLASKLGILNKDLKVESEDEYLYIPLSRKPISEIKELTRTLGHYEILIREFPRRFKAPRRAFDAAADKLPPHLLASFPRAIDIIGEVAVVEIPPELEEYKKIVGEAILQAHRHVRTVLAKSSAVRGIKRLREYEVIAGSGRTETAHREHGCIYYLDVKKVYFSPRLSFEHLRVASQVKADETVIDMFAGVGPFSILIAKMHRNVKVYSIDINPDAVRYLERNVIANRVLGKVVPILGDAREVIHKRLRGVADRVIMNLPEKAAKYVDAACEAIKREGGIIHYYRFMCGEDPIKKAEKELAKAVMEAGREMLHTLASRKVREIAPGRWQIAVDARIR